VSSRTKQWRDNDKFGSLGTYVVACNKFLENVEEIEAAVENYGSDPLNVLDLLRTPESIGEVHQGEAKVLPLPPEPAFTLPPKVAPQVDVKPTVEVGPNAKSTKQQKADRRLAEKNHKNTKWLYQLILNHPTNVAEIKRRAKAAGITEYALHQARNSVDDILVKTVGFQGPQYWYVTGDESRLPDPDKIGKVHPRKLVPLTPHQEAIMKFLPSTVAELVGKTHLTPEAVRNGLAQLATRRRATFKNGIWSKVD